MLRGSLVRLCVSDPLVSAGLCSMAGGLNKPIADILRQRGPHDASKWGDVLRVLDKHRISTANDWLEFHDDAKRRLECEDGLPFSTINDLNDAVRVELLMPSVSFRLASEFIRVKRYDDLTTSSVADEASSILEFAETVDNNWMVAMSRSHCNAFCHSYHRLVELSLKMALQGWHDQSDVRFTHYENLPVDDDGTLRPAKYYKRYKATHDLVYLANQVKEHIRDFGGLIVPAEKSLARITLCAGDADSHSRCGVKQTGASSLKAGNRISCEEFFHHAEAISPYLQNLWQRMEEHDLEHVGYDADVEWI